MRRSPLKLLAFTSVIALGFATAGDSLAQTETVNATLTTSSAITTTDTSDMDFGEWLIQFTAGDTPELTLSHSGALTVTQTGAVGNGSQVVQITAPATRGVVDVQTPGTSSLTMTRVAASTTDFTDAGLTLAHVAYFTASETGSIDSDTDTGPVTITAAATDESVNFGGVIDISATPTDGVHTAQFDVNFAY